jgi:hypothetical protein
MASRSHLHSAGAALCLLAATRSAWAQAYDESMAKELVQYSAAAYADNVQGCLKDPSRIGFGNSTVTQCVCAMGHGTFSLACLDQGMHMICHDDCVHAGFSMHPTWESTHLDLRPWTHPNRGYTWHFEAPTTWRNLLKSF